MALVASTIRVTNVLRIFPELDWVAGALLAEGFAPPQYKKYVSGASDIADKLGYGLPRKRYGGRGLKLAGGSFRRRR